MPLTLPFKGMCVRGFFFARAFLILIGIITLYCFIIFILYVGKNVGEIVGKIVGKNVG